MRRATQQKGRAPGSSAGSPAAERRKVRSLVRALLPWFRENARDLPWRRTRDPYAIWVSEIMLQQTQVGTVIPYYERWMKALPTIQSLARVSSQRLHKLWEGLGYYTRVRNLQAAARRICREHGGTFPDRYEEVLSLPGIGRYTAGAVCSIAFNQPTPIVDGNVIRVLTRLFGIAADPREATTNTQLWQLAERLVEEAAGGRKSGNKNESGVRGGDCSHLNQALMELGATVCIPRRPKCPACPVRRSCVARRERRIELLPASSSRAAPLERRYRVFAAISNRRIWAVQQPLAAWNGGLWEFPATESSARKKLPLKVAAQQALGMTVRRLVFIDTFRHSITRYQLKLELHLCHVGARTAPNGERPGRWLTFSEVRALPFSAAHRRICDRLLEASVVEAHDPSADP